MTKTSLEEHTKSQCSKAIVELTQGIWTVVGYAASNVHMIEGDSSVTIVDTTESTKAAENILSELVKLTDKPVGRIIYTHSHRDHISGATVFSGGRNIPIVASATFKSDLVGVDRTEIAPNKALGKRTLAQFGIGLSDEERISLGCGPGDRPMEGLGKGFLPPTETVTKDCEIDLDGVVANLLLSPGETADHMAVWFPESKTLIPGDNWYHTFPNLYAIRGTPYRDYNKWVQSLTQLEELHAEILAPGHTMPVFGKQNVREVLSTTRDAILSVMQQTADGMDAGLSLDDIAESVKLPENLANKPWLREYYGRASWSAKAFAVGTLGWYDGNPTNLGTIGSVKRANHIAELAGGPDYLMNAAMNTDDLQWRLELCDHLIALGAPAEKLKAETMEILAEREINATARNTYLTESKRLRNLEEK